MTTPEDIDVIVIGSGFGGSIAANRLAQAGQKVLVLERGPWRDTLPVRSFGIERRAALPYGKKALTHLLRSFHLGRWGATFGKHGLFECQSHKGVSVICASSVGGGSIAYGGLLDPPRDPHYWHARHPELDPERLQDYYPKVLADMGAVPFGRETCVPHSIWQMLPEAAARRCRAAEEQPRIAMLFPPDEKAAGQLVAGPDVPARQYSGFDGDSFLGSRGGAKASVDFVYLAPVLGRGVQVRDLCEVTGIWRAPAAEGGGYAVHFQDLVAKSTQRVHAKRVVMAAGTMNTLRLLFKSRENVGGLKDMPALGRRFGANGDLVGTLGGTGEPQSSFKASPALGAFTVDGCDGPSMGVGGFPGLDSLPLPKVLKNWLGRTWFKYGMGVDSGSGSVRFHKNRLRVDYDQRVEPIYQQIRSAFKVLGEETGRKTWAIGKPLTLHPWGGACLGADADDGVVDHRGEVYGNQGLFIADASALPAAPGGPPSLTIAAWAHHVSDGMAADSNFTSHSTGDGS